MASQNRTAVDVWYARTDDAANLQKLEQLARKLTEAERAQEQKFKLPELRVQYRFTRLLTRSILSRLASCEADELEFELGPHGKPHVCRPAGWSCAFNISHTRGAVLLAVADRGHVGADVEPFGRRVNPDLAGRYFALLEIEQLQAMDAAMRERRFMEFWTLKEAFIKALGTGLATPLHNFAFNLSMPDGPHVETYDAAIGPPSRWAFRQFEIEDEFLAAVAVLDSGDSAIHLRIHRWLAD